MRELEIVADLLRGVSGSVDMILDRTAKLQVLERAHQTQAKENEELRRLVDILSKRLEQLEQVGPQEAHV